MDSPSCGTKSTNARFRLKPPGGVTTRSRSKIPTATSCSSRSRATVLRHARELTHFPSRRDLPAPFHPAAAPVPDLIVEVDGRTDVAWDYPHFFSDERRSADLYIAMLFVQFANGPRVIDNVAICAGVVALIAR